MSEQKSYKPIAKLGEGGMAEVFLAIAIGPLGLGKLVVIKRLLPVAGQRREGYEQRLGWEALSVSAMSHPNIVHVIDFYTDDEGRYCIVMEFVDGCDLQELRKAHKKPFSVQCTAYVASEVLRGLAHAHEAMIQKQKLNLVHRDVSLNNILVSYEGGVKMSDFGVAKVVWQFRKETVEGMFVGKYNFAAPECSGTGIDIDRRADLFSVGAVLYELLCAKSAFPASLEGMIFAREGRFTPPRKINPKIPKKIEEFVIWLLRVDREQRPATAQEARASLLDIVPELARGEEEIRQMMESLIPRKRVETEPFNVPPEYARLIYGDAVPKVIAGPNESTRKVTDTEDPLIGVVPENINSQPGSETVNIPNFSPGQEPSQPSTPLLNPRRRIPIEVAIAPVGISNIPARKSSQVKRKRHSSGWGVAIVTLGSSALAIFVLVSFVYLGKRERALQASVNKIPELAVVPAKPITPAPSPSPATSRKVPAPEKRTHASKSAITSTPNLYGAVRVRAVDERDIIISLDGMGVGMAPQKFDVDPGTHVLQLEDRRTSEKKTLRFHIKAHEERTFSF